MTNKSKREILKKYTGKGGINDSINGVRSGIRGGVNGPGNSLTAKAFKQTFIHPGALPLGNARAPANLPEAKDSNFKSKK